MVSFSTFHLAADAGPGPGRAFDDTAVRRIVAGGVANEDLNGMSGLCVGFLGLEIVSIHLLGSGIRDGRGLDILLLVSKYSDSDSK